MGLLLVLVLLMMVFAAPVWPYAAAWGYYPSGTFGLVLLVLLILMLTRRRTVI